MRMLGFVGGMLGSAAPPASALSACNDALKVASFSMALRPCLKPVGGGHFGVKERWGREGEEEAGEMEGWQKLGRGKTVARAEGDRWIEGKMER